MAVFAAIRPLTAAIFEATKWRVQAFGHYAGPITMFANFYQPQMAELFKGARPIEFGIGYRWRKNESNLLLAQKESPPGSDEELTPLSQAEGNAAGTAAGAVDTVQHHELSLLNRRMHQPALK